MSKPLNQNQCNLNSTGEKKIEEKHFTIKKKTQIVVDLEASLQRELGTLWGNANEAENFTIFRTPHNISQSKKNLFEPFVISIGPFHHGKKHLQALEDQKRRFLRDFLSRKHHISLDLCISEMELLETRTRRSYSETFNDLDSNAFVQMMLLDGCFVLEYFLKLNEGNVDSVIEVGWNSHFINYDLLLQENQIPFFIVEKLYELIGYNQDARMAFVKFLAFFLFPKDSIFRDPPAETPDTVDPTDSIDPLAEILAEIPDSIDPPAEILAEIPDSMDPPAEIPAEIPHSIDPPAEILAEIPDSMDPPAEIPDSIIADPPAEIPDSTDSIDAQILAQILAQIPDPPAEIHHLVHLCYHYLVPNPEKPVVLSSKSFDLTTMFSTNRIKGFLHLFLSRVLKRRSPHSTSRSLSVALPNSTGNLSSMVIPSATELKQKGVKFTPKSNPKHMLDISFEHGVLKIPRLKIGDGTKLIFANLLAFEHSKYGKENQPFGRFVAFLDNLVNTPNDVTILQECGIIVNYLGSEEEVAHFVNQATEGAFYSSDHYLAELFKEVNRYIGSSWHRHRAKLIRDYFSSLWAAISLVAAFILLGLTCLQSFYAVYAYKFPPSS